MMRFGARMLDATHCEFNLWAPAASQMQLELETALQPMQWLADGWFTSIADCRAGARYRYRLSDGLAVPDPASRFQPEDAHGPSQVCDPHEYIWRHPHWQGRVWEEAVIYELHAGLSGGYAGIERKLPELAELGITAVELMPLADFPGKRNWGYDGVLPYAPDSAYGTPSELKRMIDQAHGLGLMVFLDVVYNHFGPDGNYLPRYAPQFFRDDSHTPWGAAIDFRRPEVRQFFIQNALCWLTEFRFDGLRFDAVHAIEDETFLPELAAAVRTALPAPRQVHLMVENEKNEARLLRGSPHPATRSAGGPTLSRDAGEGRESGLRPHLFDAQWNDDAHNALHVLLTGETESYYANYREQPAAKLARCLAEGFAYQGETSPTHGKPRGGNSGHLPPSAFIFFLQNHDQTGNRALGERLTALAHPEALRAAVALQLLCPQIPLLFMGEEGGSRAPFLFFTDFHDELADRVREGRRKEFASFKAFADPGARARIPDPNAEQTYRTSLPGTPKPEVLTEYRHLLRLRSERIAPRLRGARSLGAQALGDSAIAAVWRMGDGAELHILANFGEAAVPAEPPDLPLLHATRRDALAGGELAGRSCCVFLQ